MIYITPAAGDVPRNRSTSTADPPRSASRERSEGAPAAAVIAMTASTEAEDLEASRRAGTDGVLTKPFGMAQLRRCLDQWAVRAPGVGTV